MVFKATSGPNYRTEKKIHTITVNDSHISSIVGESRVVTHHQAILQHQLGIQQFKSILTLST